MKMQQYEASLSSADYATFGVLLTIPMLMGVYFAFKDRKDATAKQYFFGGKKMNPIAVGISTAVTSISAITMIGFPVEVYLVGTAFYWAMGGILAAVVVLYIYYVPFFNNLQLDTVYTYLGLRYNVFTRRMVAGMVVIDEIFYMGSVIYIPSLAINAVTPLPMTSSIALIGVICTFYTTLGGMNAVVWTDVVQSLLMIAASVAVFLIGTNSVGGLESLSAAVKRGERDTFFKFGDFDVSSRKHPVALVIGEFFVFTQYLGFRQAIYQRLLSCRNVRQSKNAILAYFFPAMCIIIMSIANGLLLYAYYEGCDPVQYKLIQRHDQALPLLALMEFSKILPGLAGVFVAAVFSGSLSTLSSGLNGYAMVFVEDFCPMFFPRMGQKMKVFVGKLSALVLGTIVTAMAFGISNAQGNIFMLMRQVSGSIVGSILGIYLLGIFTPWTNSAGAITGAVTGFVFMIWIFYGSNFLPHRPPRVPLLPTSVELCPAKNYTAGNTTILPEVITTTNATFTIGQIDDGYSFAETMYSINFHYYVLIGCSVTMIVGLAVSFLTGHQKGPHADPKLFMPILSNQKLPQTVIAFFRFGVPHETNRLDRDTKENSLDKHELEPLKDELL